MNTYWAKLLSITWVSEGRDSSVGIATRYGVDGPGIEFQWGREFPHPSRPAPRPVQPPMWWLAVALTTHLHLLRFWAFVAYSRVKIYLYLYMSISCHVMSASKLSGTTLHRFFRLDSAAIRHKSRECKVLRPVVCYLLGNYPTESIQHIEYGESLKSRILRII